MTIATINPATGRTERTFQPLSDAELDARVQCAADTYRRYRRVALPERTRMLIKAADILEAEKEAFGRLMTLEMGKTLKSAVDEAVKCAWGCRYYAEQAGRILAEEEVATSASRSLIRYEPIGPILAVMPWNFPFWQVFRFAAPALAAGNVGLLKHASNVPQCALAIEGIFRRAGFPEGCFQTLLIETDRVRRVIEDPRIAAATLTGSTGAGSHVASAAGKGIQALVVGDPMDPTTDIGPLANEAQVKTLADQISRSTSLGAKLLCGGHRLDRPGFYFAPGVLTNIGQDSPAYREEVFGPIALLFRVRDIDEALELANDTEFGLGASAWTQNQKELDRFITELEAGLVFINAMVASDPRVPFGGVKRSGYGRELSHYGLREFVNIKTVWIA